MKPTPFRILTSSAAALLALIPAVSHAADTTFTFPVAGGTVQWQTAAWVGGVPSATSRAVIELPAASTAAGIISVHYSSLVPNGIANAQALSFTGAGTSGLTLQNNSTGGAAGTITVLNLNGSLGAVPIIEVIGASNVTLNRLGTAADRFLDINLNGTAGDRTINAITGRTLTINSNITESEGAKKLIFNGAGSLTLAGANTFTGGFTQSNGIVLANTNGALGTGPLVINGGTFDSNVANATYTVSSISVDTGGRFAVHGTTVNNAITLNGGTLISRTTDVGNFAGPVTLTAASTISPASFSTPANAQDLFIGGKLSSIGAQTLSVSGVAAGTAKALIFTNAANDFSGEIIINSAQRLRSISTTGTGNTLGTALVTFAAGATPTVLQLRDNGAGNNGVLAYGNALSVANTATGTLDLDRASGANLGNTFALGNLSSGASTLNITAGNGYKASFTGGTLTGNATLNYTAATEVTFSGAITGGAFNLTKTGAGVLNLNGANTFTGLTSNNAGTLNVNGSLAGGVVTTAGNLNINAPVAGSVSATSTAFNLASSIGSLAISGTSSLSGIGTVTGAMTVGNGVTINPGNASGIGILHAGNTTFGTAGGDTSLVNFSVGTPGNRGYLEVGNLGVFSGASVTLKLLTALPSVGFYPIIDYSGATVDGATFGAFTLSPIANPRIIAVLNHNTANNIIELNVTAVDAPRWTGAGNGIWSVATQAPKNWQLILGGGVTDFIAGDEVLFDNNAASKTVNITTENVAPNKITVNNSGAGNDYTFNGNFEITGAASLVKTGAGALTINNVNTFTGEAALNGGTVNVSNIDTALGANNVVSFGGGTLNYTGGAASAARNLTVNAGGGTLAQNGAGDLTLAGNLLGTGVLTKTGPGKLILSGIASTVGGLTNTTGTVQIGDGAANAGALGSGPLVNNGTLVFDHTNTITMLNTISGSGPINKVNTGTVTFGGTAPNTYTGLTTVTAGTLLAGKAAGVNAISGDLRVETDGTFRYAGNNISNQIADTATVTLAGGTFGDFANANPTNPGALDTIATLNIQNGGKFGSGRNALAGGFTVSGTTTVTSGSLFVQRGGRVNTNALTVAAAGLVQLDGGATGAGEESRFVVGAGGMTISEGGKVEFNSQTNATNFTATSLGSIFVLGGDLTTTGAVDFVKNITVQAGPKANLDLTAGIHTFSVPGALNIGSAAAPILVTGAGGINKTGPGTLRITGASTFTGGTTVTEGNLILNGNAGSGPIVLNSNPLVVDFAARFDVNGPISGPAGLEKIGTGELRLLGTLGNSYTGTTKLLAGSIVANKPANILAIPGDLEISPGATFRFSANNAQGQLAPSAKVTVNGTFGDLTNTTIGAPVTISTLDVIGATALFSPGRNTTAAGVAAPFTVTGITTVGVGARAVSNSGGGFYAEELRLQGTIELDGGSATTGQESYVATGAGGLKLDGGTIKFNTGNLAALTAASKGSGVVLYGNVTSVGASSFQRISTELAPIAVVDLNGEARTFNVTDTLTIGTAALPVSLVDRTPENDGGIIKTGSGTLELNGPNTYGGVTDVQEGILSLQGAISGSSTIHVAAGAYLDASGLAGGITLGATQALTGDGNVVGNVLANGKIAPGDTGVVDIGTLSLSNPVTFGTTGVAEFQLSKAGAVLTSDLLSLNAGNTLTYDGTLRVTFTGTLAQNDTFNLFDASAFAGAFTSFDLQDPGNGLSWDTSSLGTIGTLTVVPEPTGCALLLGGLSLLAARRRRQA